MMTMTVEYQSAINNANIKCKIHRTYVTMELLIDNARRMYEMYQLGHNAHVDHKKIEVETVAASSTNAEHKFFKCGQLRYVKKDCPKKSQSSDAHGRGNDNNSSTNNT